MYRLHAIIWNGELHNQAYGSTIFAFEIKTKIKSIDICLRKNSPFNFIVRILSITIRTDVVLYHNNE